MLLFDPTLLLTALTPALIVGFALLLDFSLGEPKRWHPLIGFGNLTQLLERKLNATAVPQKCGYFTGILAWALLILPITYVTYIVSTAPWWLSPWLSQDIELFPTLIQLKLVMDCLLLYLCIGWKSLIEHVNAIRSALANSDITLARQRTQYIVSRNTNTLSEQQLSRSGIESLLENGNDAIFGCIFWFLVAGAPGAVLYRLANTLDAMWGYRTDRYRTFGWASAKLDDALNWIPARICALSYAILGNTSRAIACWKSQASAQSSPNGGPVMCSGAGSLQIILGGPTVYHGNHVDKPFFGEGHHPTHHDIGKAISLVNKTVYLWLGCIASTGVLIVLIAGLF